MIQDIGYILLGVFLAVLIPGLKAWAEVKTKDKNVPKT